MCYVLLLHIDTVRTRSSVSNFSVELSTIQVYLRSRHGICSAKTEIVLDRSDLGHPTRTVISFIGINHSVNLGPGVRVVRAEPPLNWSLRTFKQLVCENIATKD
jgi:hypothetical protein